MDEIIEKELELNFEFKLKGRLYEPKENQDIPIVLILHGIPRAKPEPGDPGYTIIAKEIAKEGFTVISFNFRGTGESSGNFHIIGWAEDLEQMLDYLKLKFDAQRRGTILVGFSGGAAVAIYVSAKNKLPKAIISVSAPAYFDFLAEKKVAELWIEGFRRIGLIKDDDFPSSLSAWQEEFRKIAPINWVDKISPRLLVIVHGEKDELIPKQQALLLFEKAKKPKELYLIEGGIHQLRKDPRTVELIRSKLKELKILFKENKIFN